MQITSPDRPEEQTGVAGDPPASQGLGSRFERLQPLLAPRSIALLGASQKTKSFGRTVFEMLRIDGYAGRVYPVNPGYAQIDDLTCYPTLAALPEAPEHVVLSVANARLEAAFEDAVACGARAVTIFGTTYLADDSEPTLGRRLTARANEAGIALCGGNSMGFYNLEEGLRVASFPSPADFRRGGIVWLAQSGSAFSALAHNDRRLGFALCVSTGMELNTTVADYMDWALDRPGTRVIGLFLEAVRDPQGFVAALEKARARHVPVVVLKVGRTDKSAAMARSHTGALAGSDAAYNALFRRYGVIAVGDLDEMAATLALFDTPRRLGPGGLATVHDSGGEREMMVDLAEQLDVSLPEVGEECRRRLADALEPGLVPENPLDAWGTDRDFVARYAECLSALVDDPAIALGGFFSDVRDDYWYSAGVVESVVQAAGRTSKPVFIASNSLMTIDARLARRIADEGIPVVKSTREALLAVRHALAWRDSQERPRETPPQLAPDVLAKWRDRLATGAPLNELDGLRLLADCGVPALQPHAVATAEEAVAAAWEIGFPVALKTAEGHAHKSDVGGVRLGLPDDTALRAAYVEMANRLGPRAIVAPMAAPGVEIGLGALIDPSFGALVMVSAGGTLIEILADKAVALAPFGPAEARALISELRIARLLAGARGAPPADLDALCTALSGFSALVAALAEQVTEIDVNPMIAGPQGAIAVDALIVPRPAAT